MVSPAGCAGAYLATIVRRRAAGAAALGRGAPHIAPPSLRLAAALCLSRPLSGRRSQWSGSGAVALLRRRKLLACHGVEAAAGLCCTLVTTSPLSQQAVVSRASCSCRRAWTLPATSCVKRADRDAQFPGGVSQVHTAASRGRSPAWTRGEGAQKTASRATVTALSHVLLRQAAAFLLVAATPRSPPRPFTPARRAQQPRRRVQQLAVASWWSPHWRTGWNVCGNACAETSMS